MPKPITPLIAADIIIELIDQPNRPFVLIERAHEPFGWAIAGGFVDVGETVEHAAIREAKEETCLDVKLTALLGIYSDPSRDTRGHTVTAVYIAEATGMPMAADDAKNFGIYTLDNLPEVLAFDHAQVIADYRVFRETGKVTPLRD
ncbi:NUDIX hydrolase [Crenothrix sp. D3]|nr:NUDIX hydrolase [Crenothrix sp. D3]